MQQNPIPDQQVAEFLEDLLFKSQANDGRDAWACLAAELITPEELRNAVLARLATWISHLNGIDEPSSDTWSTREIERTFDNAFYVADDAATRAAAVAGLVAAVDAAAAEGLAGALLLLEADGPSLDLLRGRGESDANLDEMLRRAFRVAARTLPGVVASARTSWRGHEFALLGGREDLVNSAKSLLLRLLGHPQCGCVSFRLVLTRIVPGDGRRTASADPGYDLASAPKSFVAWVDPYSAEDWQKSQRYPKTTIVFVPG